MLDEAARVYPPLSKAAIKIKNEPTDNSVMQYVDIETQRQLMYTM